MLKDKKLTATLNSAVRDVVHLRGGAAKGNLFGVELEVEGRNVAMEGVPTKGWKRVAEGSLRGEAIEYVFTAPVDYDASIKLVDGLFNQFRKNAVVLKNSHRTSTHVHLNFADKTVKNVVMFFFIHTILEELLAGYCGETRRGNLFCLSTRDNEQLVETLDMALNVHRNLGGFGENIRYCAANLAALNKFGTIEIRTMRGADDEGMVKDWLRILNQLYTYSCRDDIPSPARMLESLSHLGPDRFLEQFFDPMSIIKLRAAFAGDLHGSLMDGVRLVQMLAYKIDEAWNVPFEKPPVVEEEAPAWARGAAVDDPYTGFNLAARRCAVDAHRDMDALYTPQVAAGLWWINPGDRHIIDIAGRAAMWSNARRCFMYRDTGEPIRFIVKNGNCLEYRSEEEEEVNRGYYEYHEIFFDDDDIDIDDNDF